MTKEELSHFIQEKLSSFSNAEERPVIATVFEKLVPTIINIFQTQPDNKGDHSEELFALFESYRTHLEAAKQHLVSIDLFALIVFDGLEKEALKKNDYRLQQIWSSVGDKIIEISSQVNER